MNLHNDHLTVQLNDAGGLVGLLHHETGWQLLGRDDLARSFRLLLPLPRRRNNPVFGEDQSPPEVTRSEDAVTFRWPRVRSAFGGEHAIEVRLTYTLIGPEVVVDVAIDNRSDLTVENVYAPYLGDVRAPDDSATLRSISHGYGNALVRDLWPRFENTVGYYGIDVPTQLAEATSCYGTPVSPFLLVQSETVGLNIGVRADTPELVVWHSELTPGWADSIDSQAPRSREIGGQPVALRIAAVHVPYVLPGESRSLPPVALQPYAGDWHAGADVYTRWRDTWFRPATAPTWAQEPHSWQQLQINSAEDELRTPFAELLAAGQECADRGVAAIQLVGWNDGGQDRNNPSHDAEPRLGGVQDLADAVAAIQQLGVKVIIFSKFTWADRATQRFRDDLINQAVKDPYGDYYHYAGYRYETVTQLLDINTRRLIPMCFNSEAYLAVCAEEFAKVAALGADGMLYDECQHHTPALLCFDESHGHRLAAPVYGNDRELIRRFRTQVENDEFLMAGEACWDWQFEQYQVSYFRTENINHVPLSRYLTPRSQIMTAVTGFDDRNMINQCLLYRYVISYEPSNFKGRLPQFPATVGYGQAMDALRTELREWFWDSTFQDTVGGTVIDLTEPDTPITHHPYSIYRHADGRTATVVANYDPARTIKVQVQLDGHAGPLQSRVVGGDQRWETVQGAVDIPPRSALVIIPAT